MRLHIVLGAALPVILLAAVHSDRMPALIAETQAEIADLDGAGGYYSREYRLVETGFWKHIPKWMADDSASRPVSRILDVGCGYGTLLLTATKLYGASGYCLDMNEYLWPRLRETHGIRFARANVELEPIPWSGFDVVIFTEVLEHFNFQPLPTLRKIFEAMNPGATLFLSTPDEFDWGRKLKYYQHLSDLPMPDPSMPVRDDHIWIYSKKELLGLLEQCGFRIQRRDHTPAGHFNIMARKPPLD